MHTGREVSLQLIGLWNNTNILLSLHQQKSMQSLAGAFKSIVLNHMSHFFLCQDLNSPSSCERYHSILWSLIFFLWHSLFVLLTCTLICFLLLFPLFFSPLGSVLLLHLSPTWSSLLFTPAPSLSSPELMLGCQISFCLQGDHIWHPAVWVVGCKSSCRS